jgi:hypothetical protein
LTLSMYFIDKIHTLNPKTTCYLLLNKEIKKLLAFYVFEV